ncbi:hypothetical protein P691DRAFT_798323 [Macrolepiota fuliginosa MF-IS2]|uniref:Uncharacterized protein n=1 Tax=Macrolepiota fuliginosa MF-IS2 TaxID=1400762 RepID=A0A9P5X162_9AGAR|nr:hypothetical protein P691DRAFT_798323 [Macrolepiota fuliginosa MF-IS2]
MVDLSLPSWVSKGSAYPGQAKGGKLHADQCHWAKMLENFLYLVSVVKVMSRRTIMEQDILLYEDHMQRYLQTLWDLYPGIELAPYQHIALHFGQMEKTMFQKFCMLQNLCVLFNEHLLP